MRTQPAVKLRPFKFLCLAAVLSIAVLTSACGSGTGASADKPSAETSSPAESPSESPTQQPLEAVIAQPYVALLVEGDESSQEASHIDFYSPVSGTLEYTLTIPLESEIVPATNADGQQGRFGSSGAYDLAPDFTFSVGSDRYENGDVLPAKLSLLDGKVTDLVSPTEGGDFTAKTPKVYQGITVNPVTGDVWAEKGAQPDSITNLTSGGVVPIDPGGGGGFDFVVGKTAPVFSDYTRKQPANSIYITAETNPWNQGQIQVYPGIRSLTSANYAFLGIKDDQRAVYGAAVGSSTPPRKLFDVPTDVTAVVGYRDQT